MNTKQFTGFFSSVTNPGQLSLTVSSIRNVVLSGLALFLMMKGLHGEELSATTTQFSSQFDLIAAQFQLFITAALAAFSAALTLYHTLRTFEGLTTKIMHGLFAKPVLTVPAAVPTPIVETMSVDAPI